MEPYEEIAVSFASALVKGDYPLAHALLAPGLHEQLTPEQLGEKLFSMFRSYSNSQPKRTRLDHEYSIEEWPEKLPGDLGIAYVGIEGDDFAEAVTVTVADVGAHLVIREIEWGRP